MTRLCCQRFDSPVGPLAAIVVDREGAETLAALEFAEGPRFAREERELCAALDAEPEDARLPLHDEVERQLSAYFAGQLTEFTLPLETPGTEFQQRVWGALLEIPFGTTCSYGRLAERIGSPGAQRAVGAANGANRVSIVVPCHRVIESGGGLRGYGGGLERKRFLLQLEGAWPTHATLFDAKPPAEATP
ncbi:MAG: methylated-DNA--[protein]-cysteine S-methyltransferase [Planctomycetota bacterium]|nr:methylated-DNA--[protein]-cysteine S-methyltransferase [Planctomycetota bacterium]